MRVQLPRLGAQNVGQNRITRRHKPTPTIRKEEILRGIFYIVNSCFMQLRKELMDLQIQAYDKGFNDAIDGIKEAFEGLKVLPLESIKIDKIIEMIEMAKVEGNKIKTTHNP